MHPHAIRVMLRTLEEIAGQDQIVFTTHSNEFVNRVPIKQIHIFQRINASTSHVTSPELRGISSKRLVQVQRYLQESRSDMLFARGVLLVEGQTEFFALPSLARTLGHDIDRDGISIVFTSGDGNIETYHKILEAFDIPHAILGDGDGKQLAKQSEYSQLLGDSSRVFVLENDFETLLVNNLPETTLIKITNECLGRLGRSSIRRLRTPKSDVLGRVNDLASLTKPLVGQVVGEILPYNEINQLQIIVNAINQVVQISSP